MILIKSKKEYIGFKESNYMEIPPWEEPSELLTDNEIDAFENIEVKLKETSKIMNEYAICIPRAYARGESKEEVSMEDVENVPHYELYVEQQVGSPKVRRDTYIYFRLPKSGKIVNIILYMDGGVGFDPLMHKYIIRETDELDRRIILGFCRMNESSLQWACHDKKEKDKFWLQNEARKYKASKQPKRFKVGSAGNDFTYLYNNLAPYDESNMFKQVQFI